MMCVYIYIIVCDVETSTMRHFRPDLGCGTTENKESRNTSDLRCNMGSYIDCTDYNGNIG